MCNLQAVSAVGHTQGNSSNVLSSGIGTYAVPSTLYIVPLDSLTSEMYVYTPKSYV